MSADSNDTVKYLWCAFVLFFTCWLCVEILFGYLPVEPYERVGIKDAFHSAQNLAINAIKEYGKVQTAIGTFLIGGVTAVAVFLWPNE